MKVRTCPLCNSQRWEDGRFVLDLQDLNDFRFMGYSIKEISAAINYARVRGWEPNNDPPPKQG